MDSRVISAILTLKDKDFSSGLKGANGKLTELGRAMKRVENQISSFGQSVDTTITNIGKGAAGLATGALAGLGAIAANTFYEMDQAFAKLEAQTGATGAELADLQGAATDVFKRGYGESLAEVGDALARVKQNMQGITGKEIEDVTANALLLAKTFDSDVNEVTRGVNNLMENFGVTVEQAFDMFAAGGQRGLNFSNEMFENVAEYSSLFQEAGYSVEEYFGILERGAQNGVYNLDYVNDVVGEFQKRIKDGSKTTSDAMGLMSKDTQKVWQQFLKGDGTVKDVASTIISELKGMDDQVKAGQIGVELFGTRWEDLESDAVYAMLGTTEAMKNFEGATEQAANAVEGLFSNRIKSAFRDATMSIAELGNTTQGKELLDWIASSVEKLVPLLTELGQKALDFATFIKDNWTPIKETIIAVTAAAVAFKASLLAMSIISTVTTWINTMRTAVTLAGGAFKALNIVMRANPIGVVITLVTALVGVGVLLYRNWDMVKLKASELWAKVSEVFSNIYNWGAEKIGGVTSFFSNLIKKVSDFISRITNFKMPEWISTVGEKVGGAVSKISGFINGSHATGLNRVPFDGYVAELHEGEMVIPARQAEKIREQGGNIHNVGTQGGTVTNNTSNTSSVVNRTNNNSSPVINMTVNANQLSYDEVTRKLSKDLILALLNM